MNKILKWVTIAGIFLVPFTPLIISSSLLFPFITGKAFFFRIVVDIIFATYLILAVRDPEYRPKKSWISLAVFGLLTVAFLADSFGINPHKSFWSNFERMEGFFMILHLWMYFFVASGIMIKKYWYHWMNTSIGVSVIIAIYGLFQLGGAIDIRQGSDRLDGTLGNAAYLAVYMLLSIGLALYVWIERSKHVWAHMTYSIVILLQLFIIYKTATRGTIIGIGVGLFIASVLYAWKAKGDLVGRRIAFAVIALVVVSVTTLYIAQETSFVKNSNTLNRVAQSLSVKKLLDNPRAKYIWPIAIEGIKEKPILGYGQDGFNYVFNKFYNPKMWTEEAWFDRAHNVFLDWFIAAGLLGFLAYILLYILALRAIWKGDFTLKEKAVLVGILAAYAVHNMTVFDNISSYILFFSLLAFLHTQTAKEYINKYTINIDVRDLIVTPIIIIISGALLYFTSIVPIRVGTAIIDGFRQHPEGYKKNIEMYLKAMSYNVTGSQEAREQIIQNAEGTIKKTDVKEIKQDFFILAQQAITQQIQYAPLDARGYLFGGSFYNHMGAFDLASPLLQKAHELTPNKQLPLLELSINGLNKNDYKSGLDNAKKALDLDPNYPEAQKLYGFVIDYIKKNPIQNK
ncbi:MAG: O-antigen ligase family protein [Candidatus Pacebacteria bacterium]|nr:O-antigen ligase family protein [Candidatus Paceibacterota bacterium]